MKRMNQLVHNALILKKREKFDRCATHAFVGLAVWQQASASQRRLIEDAVARAMRQQPEKVVEITKLYNHLDDVCDRRSAASLAACDHGPD